MRAGLVGIGFMGSSHISCYNALKGKAELVAICDVDEAKLASGKSTQGNIKIGSSDIDVSSYKLYKDMEDMIKNESLDYVDLCLPTYIHGEMAVRAMEAGMNVFCEKPMSISSDDCQRMIDTAKRTGKSLMIGHTLRYWNVYEYAKACIDDKRYGDVVSGYFFRGGGTPKWSWENWLLTKEKSGGCLLDQHVHDVDTINWLFGMPKAVSTIGKRVFPNSGYDAVSTNYIYDDGKVINAQDDWSMNGNGFGFEMLYRINFERGCLIYTSKGTLTVCPEDGEAFEPQLTTEDAYVKELRLFNEALKGETKIDFISLLESHRDTIRLAEAEILSADRQGQRVEL